MNFNPLPNKPCLLRVSGASLLKTQWKKEKLLKSLKMKSLKLVVWERAICSTDYFSLSKGEKKYLCGRKRGNSGYQHFPFF